jgi:hypothetical protein
MAWKTAWSTFAWPRRLAFPEENHHYNRIRGDRMNDDWKELMPDPDDYRASVADAAFEAVMAVAKVMGMILAVALVLSCIAYAVWREVLVIGFLTG